MKRKFKSQLMIESFDSKIKLGMLTEKVKFLGNLKIVKNFKYDLKNNSLTREL